MGFLLSLVISLALSGIGFRWARNVMTRRLRYVDAAQNRLAPIVAGLIAAIIVMPFTWMPLIGAVTGAGTAIACGLGVGLGVASASRDIRLGTYRIEN
jgi:hypothetical protein